MAVKLKGRVQPLRSSLPFQILLYFNGWYFLLFFLLELAGFIWKGVTFPYPSGTLAAEIIIVFLLGIVALLQLYNGLKGNLTERVIGVFIFLLLCVPAVFGALYLLLWQSYVLTYEVVIIVIQLAFLACEILFCIISLITFARAPEP